MGEGLSPAFKEAAVIREKIQQTLQLLPEFDLDMWLIFVRESAAMADPAMELVVGTHCTWQSAFAYTRDGKAVAIVGNLDKTKFEELGVFTEVRSYVTGIGEELRRLFDEVKPKRFALNVSTNDYMSDGLTCGMYRLLERYLEGTEWMGRWVSSEGLIAALRGRKTKAEQKRIQAAIDLTEEIFDKVTEMLRPGLSEKDVAAFILNLVDEAGVETAWDRSECPAVFTGPESAGAHCGPTDRKIEPGHVMNIDFGVKKDGFCSDLQRTWYFLRPGETRAPEEVRKAFDTIVESIRLGAEKIRPGMTGLEVDTLVRTYITDKGYPEYPHATGHQVGRSTHDGAALLAPEWERYGEIPRMKIEENQVYTIEPRITVEGFGVATLEDIIVVTPNGGRFLSHPQREIWYVQ